MKIPPGRPGKSSLTESQRANHRRDARDHFREVLQNCRAAAAGQCRDSRPLFPIPVVVLDQLHHVVAANASFLELIHKSRREISGKAISNLIWPIEGGAELYHLVDEVLRSGMWFQNHVIGGLDARPPLGPLAIGAHRIFDSEAPDPLVLLTVQPCESDSSAS